MVSEHRTSNPQQFFLPFSIRLFRFNNWSSFSIFNWYCFFFSFLSIDSARISDWSSLHHRGFRDRSSSIDQVFHLKLL